MRPRHTKLLFLPLLKNFPNGEEHLHLLFNYSATNFSMYPKIIERPSTYVEVSREVSKHFLTPKDSLVPLEI